MGEYQDTDNVAGATPARLDRHSQGYAPVFFRVNAPAKKFIEFSVSVFFKFEHWNIRAKDNGHFFWLGVTFCDRGGALLRTHQ
jgi:hypothetical protein